MDERGQIFGIYLLSSKRFKVSTAHYGAANAIFCRIDRIATEEYTWLSYILLTKCVPILLYGLEACSIRKTDLDSLDFVVNSFFCAIVSY